MPDNIKEWEGLAKCRDRHGRPLALRELGTTPIDWNMNGFIDMAPVDLFGSKFCYATDACAGDKETQAFIQIMGAAETVRSPFPYRVQTDDVDWNTMAITVGPYGLPKGYPLIGQIDTKHSIRRAYTW